LAPLKGWFNDHEVTDMKDLPKLVADVVPGQHVKVTVWRQGKKQDLEVSIALSPEVTANAAGVPAKAVEGARLGVALAPMSEELRQRFDVPGGVGGALVVEIEPGSPAAREGMQPGDVIVQAGGRWISEPADVVSVVRESNAADQDGILLLVNRKGDRRFVIVQPG
jgi:serine protease Do